MPGQKKKRKVSTVNRKANLIMRFSEFQLPPIQDALIIGKRTSVGVNGITRAFQEMSPGIFKLIKVDHPIIEAILVKKSDLRKLPEKEFIPRLIEQSEKVMDETTSLHVSISIDIIVSEEGIELNE
jgi:hypothetical protein